MNSSRFYKVLELIAYIIVVAAILVVCVIQRGKPQEEAITIDEPGISVSAGGGMGP